MENINFSADYPKLAGQTTAVLKKIVPFKLDKAARETYKELLERDTLMSNGDHYPLRDGKYIIMYFEGNLGVEFTTIRYAHAYYGGKMFDRETWATERIGQEFQININIKPQDVINAPDSIAKQIVHYKKPKATPAQSAHCEARLGRSAVVKKKIVIKKRPVIQGESGYAYGNKKPFAKPYNKPFNKGNKSYKKPFNKFNNQRTFDGRKPEDLTSANKKGEGNPSPFKNLI